MPDGVLSEREYDLLRRWYARAHPFRYPRGIPKNEEGIRQSAVYKEFLREEPIARPTARAVELAEQVRPLPPGVVAAPETPGEAIRRMRRAEEEVAGIDLAGVEVPPQPTQPPPAGFRWGFDRDLNRWVPQFTGQEELQRQQLELQRQQLAGFPPPTGALGGGAGVTPRVAPSPRPGPWRGAEGGIGVSREDVMRREEARPAEEVAPTGAPTDPFGRIATWNARLGQWDYPPNWGQRPADEPDPFQQQQFGLQEQQLAMQQQQFRQQLEFQQSQLQAAQEEQERQYMSQLAAQPINWLQYAAYTGQPPVVQPWMVPLGFQNQGGAATPGQPIPGFEGQAGQQGIQTFAGLPQLTTPSAQLQARWGPTAQAQFLGYRQARTGALPEETQFRLGAGRAPAGAFGGFSRFR